MTIFGSEFLVTLLVVNTCLTYAVYPMAVLGRTTVAPIAYMAVGAYAGAYAVEQGYSIWIGCAGGVAISLTLALLLSGVVGHLRSHFFVAATLGLAFIVQQLAFGLPSLTNGYLGVTEPAGLVSQLHLWLLLAICMAGAIALKYSFLDSIWRAIGKDDAIAGALGVSVRHQVFVAGSISAVIASIVGTLYGNLIAFFDPNTFGFVLVLYLIIAVVAGGTASWHGPIIGGMIMTLLPEALRSFGSLREAVLGVLLALCVLFLPEGLSDQRGAARLLRNASGRVRRFGRQSGKSGGSRKESESTPKFLLQERTHDGGL